MNDRINFIPSKIKNEIEKDPSSMYDFFDHIQLKDFLIDSEEDIADISFSLGYTYENFYLIVKSDQDELMNRDRAYQNGDGFHFVLAKQKNDGGPTDEFYVISVSPLNKEGKRCFIWYKNIDFVAQSFENSEVTVNKGDGHHHFLVKIPFDEIPPLKPFLYSDYGFNLAYIQAVEEGKNIYILKEDRNIQSEQSLRKYVAFDFEEPSPEGSIQWNIDLNRYNLNRDQSLYLKIGANGPNDQNVSMNVRVNDEMIFETEVKIREGLNRWDFPLDISKYGPGDHEITVTLDEGKKSSKFVFSITRYDLEEINSFEKEIGSIQTLDDKKIQESISSIEYKLEDIYKSVDEIKPYEDFHAISKKIEYLKSDIEKVRQGKDLFIKGEDKRLAFRSEIDGSLQPYSIFIPENLSRSPPMIVFLHGSGTDDRSIFRNEYNSKLAKNSSSILLAPFARGTSHAYSPEYSLGDVEEIVKKMIEIWDVDRDNIYLAGFSMGGYGVLRNYDHDPEIYSGLIIISGIYSFDNEADYLKSKFGDIDIPNYSEDDKITRFSSIPMIFFHGKEDKNCSYNDMKRFIDSLREINENVEAYYKEDRGHSGLKDDWYRKLERWLNKQIDH